MRALWQNDYILCFRDNLKHLKMNYFKSFGVTTFHSSSIMHFQIHTRGPKTLQQWFSIGGGTRIQHILQFILVFVYLISYNISGLLGQALVRQAV